MSEKNIFTVIKRNIIHRLSPKTSGSMEEASISRERRSSWAVHTLLFHHGITTAIYQDYIATNVPILLIIIRFYPIHSFKKYKKNMQELKLPLR